MANLSISIFPSSQDVMEILLFGMQTNFPEIFPVVRGASDFVISEK